LLWVLAVAAIGKLGLNLIVAARLVALLGMLGAIVGLVTAARRINASLADATIAGLFFVLSAPIGIWAVAGLEQPLVMAFLSLGVAAVWTLLNRERIRWHDGAAAGF
jgi:arabinofuranosyltransferase